MKTIFSIAWLNLVRGLSRYRVVVVIVGAVTAAFVVMLSLSGGIRSTFVASAALLGSGHVTVAGYHKTLPTAVNPVVPEPDPVEAVARDVAPRAEILRRDRQIARLYSATNATIPLFLNGVDVDRENALRGYLKSTQSESHFTGLATPDTIAIFATHARRLGVGVGDTITARAEYSDGRVNTRDLTVVDVYEDVGLLSNWTVWTSTQTAKALYQAPAKSTGALQVYLDDYRQSERTMAQVRSGLEAAGYTLTGQQSRPYFNRMADVAAEPWTGLRLNLTTWEDEVSYIAWILPALDAISAMVLAALLIIVAIGILNTLMIAMRERTMELGTLRAIGMTRRGLLAAVLLEAWMLGLLSAVTGACAGVVIAMVLQSAEIEIPSIALKEILLSDVLTFRVHLSQVVLSIFAVSTFTAVVAAWPALRAARVQPVTAMRGTST